MVQTAAFTPLLPTSSAAKTLIIPLTNIWEFKSLLLWFTALTHQHFCTIRKYTHCLKGMACKVVNCVLDLQRHGSVPVTHCSLFPGITGSIPDMKWICNCSELMINSKYSSCTFPMYLWSFVSVVQSHLSSFDVTFILKLEKHKWHLKTL